MQLAGFSQVSLDSAMHGGGDRTSASGVGGYTTTCEIRTEEFEGGVPRDKNWFNSIIYGVMDNAASHRPFHRHSFPGYFLTVRSTLRIRRRPYIVRVPPATLKGKTYLTTIITRNIQYVLRSALSMHATDSGRIS